MNLPPTSAHNEHTQIHSGNRAGMSQRWRSLFIVLAVLLLDQTTKIAVEKQMPLGHTIPLLPFFSLSHVQNTGAAFGMFANSNGAFIVLTVVILVLLAKMHRELTAQGNWAKWGVLLVWGGAVGNLVDRIRNGSVTDFLDFYWRGWHWPAFNVADSAITVGVALLFVQNFMGRGKIIGQIPHPPLRGTFPQEGKENNDFPSPLGRGQGEGPGQLRAKK